MPLLRGPFCNRTVTSWIKISEDSQHFCTWMTSALYVKSRWGQISVVCFSVFWVSHKLFADFAWSVLLRHLLSFWLSSLHGFDDLPVSVRFSDPTAMSTSSGVDHAVIGGVVAVIVFIMLCLLIVLGRYLIRHKGTAQSHITLIRQRNPSLSFTHMHRSNQTQRDRTHTHTSEGIITFRNCGRIPDWGLCSVLPHQQLFFFLNLSIQTLDPRSHCWLGHYTCKWTTCLTANGAPRKKMKNENEWTASECMNIE